MSSQDDSCHRCGRRLTGAIETHYMSLVRLVCITTIETPDCNWTRCRQCRKSVCKSCFVTTAAMCTDCFVADPDRTGSNPVRANGQGPNGPDTPFGNKKAA